MSPQNFELDIVRVIDDGEHKSAAVLDHAQMIAIDAVVTRVSTPEANPIEDILIEMTLDNERHSFDGTAGCILRLSPSRAFDHIKSCFRADLPNLVRQPQILLSPDEGVAVDLVLASKHPDDVPSLDTTPAVEWKWGGFGEEEHAHSRRTSVGREILEAAVIDGAGRWGQRIGREVPNDLGRDPQRQAVWWDRFRDDCAGSDA